MEQQVIPEEWKEFKLKTYSFFEDTVQIQLPEFMQDMSPNEEQRIFTSNTMSQTILSASQDYPVLSFSKQPCDASINSIEEFIEQQRKVFCRIIPGYIEFGRGTKMINSLNVGCIQYKSNAIDQDLYNIFFSLKHKVEIYCGVLVTPYDFHEIWTSIFLNCIETLHIKKETDY